MIYLFAMCIKDIYPEGLWSLASPPYTLILCCSAKGTPPYQNYCQVMFDFILLIGYFKMNDRLPCHTYKRESPSVISASSLSLQFVLTLHYLTIKTTPFFFLEACVRTSQSILSMSICTSVRLSVCPHKAALISPDRLLL